MSKPLSDDMNSVWSNGEPNLLHEQPCKEFPVLIKVMSS